MFWFFAAFFLIRMEPARHVNLLFLSLDLTGLLQVCFIFFIWISHILMLKYRQLDVIITLLSPLLFRNYFFQLINWFQLFLCQQKSKHCKTCSEQVKNDLFERRCRWFQLFFNDFQLLYFLIFPVFRSSEN